MLNRHQENLAWSSRGDHEHQPHDEPAPEPRRFKHFFGPCYTHKETESNWDGQKGTEVRGYVMGTSESGCRRVRDVVLKTQGLGLGFNF